LITKRHSGRPRAFDYDVALDSALKVFWSKGYEGASLSDLTKAMGINRPSLYAAFGDKETLFRRAMQRYVSEQDVYITESLNEPTTKRVAERLLANVIDAITRPHNPHGCLLVHSALVGGNSISKLQAEVTGLRKEGEAAIRKRMERARAEGDLPSRVRPRVLAKYLATVINGLAVQAASGVPRSKLREVKDCVLRAWPSGHR
jgi:AcrR family transcriptional regulator